MYTLNELQLKLQYAKDFAPHKVGYYEQLIKDIESPKTVLGEAIKLLGYQGGTIHQVKEEILAMQPMQRGIFLNKLKEAIGDDLSLFKQYMAEYNPLRTSHLNFTSL